MGPNVCIYFVYSIKLNYMKDNWYKVSDQRIHTHACFSILNTDTVSNI